MTASLRRFREPKPPAAPGVAAGERCEMCAAPIDASHQHVVDVERRALQCACRPCYLLFTVRGAAAGKYRAVPDRVRHEPEFTLAAHVWESAGIPVSMAFFFANSATGTTVAFYPSPAGATESMLAPEAWGTLLGENPAFADIEPDVEALLVNRSNSGSVGGSSEGSRGDFLDGFEAFLVPIDACYELVGHVRLHWRGFDGGTAAHEVIDGFFADLRARAGTTPSPASAGEASHG